MHVPRSIWAIGVLSLWIISLYSAAAIDTEESPFRRPPIKTPKNYYLFLNLDQQQLADEADRKAEDVPTDAEKEKLRNQYYKEEITRACKVKREALQQQIEDATKAVEQADELMRVKKENELLQLRFDLDITSNICPNLLDPKKRKEYNTHLTKLAEADENYFAQIQQGVSEAFLLSPSTAVLLNHLIAEALAELIKNIPGPATKIFNQNIALRSISALSVPYGPEVRYGIGFSGLMAFNQFEIRVSVYIVQDIYGEKRASISFELPEHYKISDLIPTITWLDTFTFGKGKIIISNFDGTDVDGFQFKKGFNYGAIVDLKGPLAALSALKDRSATLKSLVFESKPIILSGVINPFDLSKTTFTIEVPLYFGIDLRKISFIPSKLSKVINQITTDELDLSVMPFKKRIIGIVPRELQGFELPTLLFRIKAEAGARIVLGTQKDPIRLTINGLLEPPSAKHPEGYLTLGANLKNMLEFDVFAIGDASIQFDFEPELMKILAASGYPLPFTGLLLAGRIDLGKPGDTRAQLKVAGGFRAMTEEQTEEILTKEVEAKEGALPKGQQLVDFVAREQKKLAAQLPALLLDLNAENIDFGALIDYTIKSAVKAGFIKKQVPAGVIPSIKLHKLWGHLALTDVRIADKEYKAGIGLQVETEFWQRKAGFRLHINEAFRLSGWGYMPHINIMSQGKEVFRLQGIAEDKGPRLAFSFDPREPQKGMFALNAALIIPALGLKQSVDFRWYSWWLNADFESKFAGFTAIFGMRMNLKAKPPVTKEIIQAAEQEVMGRQEEETIQEMARIIGEKITPDDYEKWRQLYIKFGFRDDFADFLNQQVAPALRALKEQSIARLDKLSQFIAQQQREGTAAAEQEIITTQEEIAVLQEEITALQDTCNKAPRMQQIACRASIAAKQAKVQAKKLYLNALARPKKAIISGTTEALKRLAQAKALRMATEAVLEGASRGIELLAAGVKLLHIKEAVGEYSYRDIISFKLPRLVILVLELNFGEAPVRFVLEDLQFDFKKPRESCARIIFTVLQSLVASQNEKYARYVTRLAA